MTFISKLFTHFIRPTYTPSAEDTVKIFFHFETGEVSSHQLTLEELSEKYVHFDLSEVVSLIVKGADVLYIAPNPYLWETEKEHALLVSETEDGIMQQLKVANDDI